ncbi:glycoside hydrolase family 43 protein [Kineococcus sp. SYSU DK003]|uniref:glycoside hydrolase family 43 protein n=1 Tax=Kineococcus sp. SYSU DK003 TaxID=3383124 RepID=UPI003D7DB6E9
MADDVLETLAEFPAHDPFVLPVAHDGTYRLYSAAHGEHPGVVVRTSTDLRNWSAPRPVFTVPADCWADPSAAPWAPEVHLWRGRYHLFTTLHQPADALPPVRQGGTTFVLGTDDPRWRLAPARRGTVVAVSDSPDGPFELLDPSGPVPPAEFMTLDGTLHVDRAGRPWMVYAHEWVQILDGTVEAVPLQDDLSRAAGPPVHLFRGSEASWQRSVTPGTASLAPYVTDGPQLRRLPGGALAALWSSYRAGGAEYVQTWAISRTGELTGHWEQRGVLVGGDAGHGMLFETFEGRTVLVLHRGTGTQRVRAELHEVRLFPDEVQLAGPLR